MTSLSRPALRGRSGHAGSRLRAAAAQTLDEQHDRGHRDDRRRDEEPRLPRVGALPQRVPEPEGPRERGEAMQTTPPLRADPPARVVGEPERHHHPPAHDPHRRPGPLVAADEGDRQVGEARLQVAVAEQRDDVHDERREGGERERLVDDAHVCQTALDEPCAHAQPDGDGDARQQQRRRAGRPAGDPEEVPVRRGGAHDATASSAVALPDRSYRPPLVTCLPACWTAAITVLAPTRPSAPGPPIPPLSTRTQRILPSRTASASHCTLTSLSRPEKPPIPATFAPLEMIDCEAPCWLETPIVPPPWALT